MDNFMKLKDLLKGYSYTGNADVEITGIACDSREVKKGFAFVCIKGYETDGHKYAQNALSNGASVIISQEELSVPSVIVSDSRKIFAVLCTNFYNNPTKEFTLIGITGTNGKTSTTYFIKQILEEKGYKVGLIGTNQNMIGQKAYETSRTTPDSFELNKIFRQMADEKCQYVVMEVSSHSLYLDRVYGCEFDVGAFINLTQDHLDFHKTMENYLAAKAILFTMCKKGVVNTDDPYSDKIIKTAKCPMTGYGIYSECDIKAEDIVYHSTGVEFSVGNEKYKVAVPGEFSVYNALTAISVCKALGIDYETIVKGLGNIKGVKGRAQVVELGFDFTVLIDYAHTPDGIEKILNTVRKFTKGKLIILFGCGGDRDNTKRPIMGKIASELADFCIITSDNPRTEDPGKIMKEIILGIDKENYITIENRKEAMEYALRNACKDDIIVLAGKGHETYQTIGKENFDFDEEAILFEIKEKIAEENK
jgi:UDP-N-acetylmuramoyl-L-alanyl-D-glutamate--2,6-diaminopimelate ligase